MLFRDYVELLYQAYLQDKGYLQTLRDMIRSQEFSKDQIYNPAFENWEDIRHEDPSTHHQGRWKYHPNPINPEAGVFVFEEVQKSKKQWGIIKDCVRRKQKGDQYKRQQAREDDR
ncbi:hypothetical protein OMCYN_01632 [cyanobiont of Ornithocercus magnificus]|nr:hypothetical protein OMCYN_01632 [cyanobiont of Ornithocercus magnificus]